MDRIEYIKEVFHSLSPLAVIQGYGNRGESHETLNAVSGKINNSG